MYMYCTHIHLYRHAYVYYVHMHTCILSQPLALDRGPIGGFLFAVALPQPRDLEAQPSQVTQVDRT